MVLQNVSASHRVALSPWRALWICYSTYRLSAYRYACCTLRDASFHCFYLRAETFEFSTDDYLLLFSSIGRLRHTFEDFLFLFSTNVSYLAWHSGLFTRLLTTEIIRLQTMYLSKPAKTRLRVLRDPAGPLSHIAYLAHGESFCPASLRPTVSRALLAVYFFTSASLFPFAIDDIVVRPTFRGEELERN